MSLLCVVMMISFFRFFRVVVVYNGTVDGRSEVDGYISGGSGVWGASCMRWYCVWLEMLLVLSRCSVDECPLLG